MDEINALLDASCVFDPDESPAEHFANICPVCEGSGVDDPFPYGARDWETGEPLDDEEPCACCGGSGWLTASADDEGGSTMSTRLATAATDTVYVCPDCGRTFPAGGIVQDRDYLDHRDDCTQAARQDVAAATQEVAR